MGDIQPEPHGICAKRCQVLGFIIDGLDECHVSDGGRKKLISEISNLRTKTEVNLFTTSQFIPDIEKEFESSLIGGPRR